MVLQHARRASTATQPRIDPSRILGISGTLALNLLALLMLLIPMQLPAPLAPAERPQEFHWIDARKPDVTPPPPERVEVVRPQAPVQPARPVPAIAPQPVEPVLVDGGTLPALPPVEAPAGETLPTLAPAGPVSGMALEYAQAPAPAYPREAVRRSLEGTVLLEVLVDVDGRPLRVDIHSSSGQSMLDREAQRHVLRHWRFRPATKDGHAVQAIGIVPIDFRLAER